MRWQKEAYDYYAILGKIPSKQEAFLTPAFNFHEPALYNHPKEMVSDSGSASTLKEKDLHSIKKCWTGIMGQCRL
jgi:hypothetical protein